MYLTDCLLFVLSRLYGAQRTCSHHVLGSTQYKQWIVIPKSRAAYSSIPEWGVFPDGTSFGKELHMLIPCNSGRELCNQRLCDQENSSHRLAIRRGMWMPWTSWNLAAFRWLAWLAAHFFSLFGSHVPPLHSSFLAAHSSYAALPFPVSAGGWYAYSPFLSWFPLLSVPDHYAQTFPGLCIISDVPCRSPTCHHAFSSLCTLSFIARLLTLKKVCRGAKKLTIIASSYLFLFVFLYSIYLFYFLAQRKNYIEDT